jgi:hypothetical protein
MGIYIHKPISSIFHCVKISPDFLKGKAIIDNMVTFCLSEYKALHPFLKNMSPPSSGVKNKQSKTLL